MDRYVPDRRSILSYFSSATETPVSNTAAILSVPVIEDPVEVCNIFCDGACINNGRRGARAAWGVAVYLNDVEIAASGAPLMPDETQTNQRAELRGLQVAVAAATTSTAPICRIYTDSEYAINCLTRWGPGWARAGWRKADGGPVLHRDLIEPLLDAWHSLRGKAQIAHVRAHTGRMDNISMGNARADELARVAIGSTE
jgi:ribonuclease HI